MRKQAQSNVPLYVRIAERFTHQVANGVLRPGDRVPSLRRLSKEQGVSLSTALQRICGWKIAGIWKPGLNRDSTFVRLLQN
jgi:DNA-binding transcriptional MocR family regulator